MQPVQTDVDPVLKPLNPIRAVLYDVYGTLFISASGDLGKNVLQNETADRLFKQYRLDSTLSAGELARRFEAEIRKAHHSEKARGADFPEVRYDVLWQNILGTQNTETARIWALVYELAVNPVFPMPFAKEVIEGLKRSGMRQGLISNAQFFTPLLFPALMQADMETLGIDPELVFFSCQWGRAKPSPLLFKEALERLLHFHVQPETVLFIGNDMLNDILPARSAGFCTALFAGDRRSLRLRRDMEKCRNLSPDLVITEWNQLLDCLKEP